ncbi:GNAT family N-acetyltransferase [bacterium SCSIO 12643]|nr:GNAT family N-acetyltransferase [bacterium SCSIO 12643]
MEFQIRPVKSEDALAITRLSDQLGYRSPQKSIATRIELILKDPNHQVFVAVLNQQIVGWIHGFYVLKIESEPFMEIGGLIVDDQFRKMGIGKKLVQQIVIWSNHNGISKLRVRCNVIRLESHKFYETIGFELNKEQKVFDRFLG